MTSCTLRWPFLIIALTASLADRLATLTDLDDYGRGGITSTTRRSDRCRPGRRDPTGYAGDVGLHLSQIDEADELLTNDALALLIGMVLDQQIGQTRNGG